MLMHVSDKILRLSRVYPILRYRLADVHDLIAAEGKYHLKCHSKFCRVYNDNEDIISDLDQIPKQACFNTVCDDLLEGLSNGKMYSLYAIWKRYRDLLSELAIDSIRFLMTSQWNIATKLVRSLVG